MLEVDFGSFQRAFLDFHVGLRLMQSGFCLIEICLRGILLGDELLRSFLSHLCEFERSFRAIEIALCLRHRRLENGRINFRDYLAGLYR